MAWDVDEDSELTELVREVIRFLQGMHSNDKYPFDLRHALMRVDHRYHLNELLKTEPVVRGQIDRASLAGAVAAEGDLTYLERLLEGVKRESAYSRLEVWNAGIPAPDNLIRLPRELGIMIVNHLHREKRVELYRAGVKL